MLIRGPPLVETLPYLLAQTRLKLMFASLLVLKNGIAICLVHDSISHVCFIYLSHTWLYLCHTFLLVSCIWGRKQKSKCSNLIRIILASAYAPWHFHSHQFLFFLISLYLIIYLSIGALLLKSVVCTHNMVQSTWNHYAHETIKTRLLSAENNQHGWLSEVLQR